jgi:hypothetical protein
MRSVLILILAGMMGFVLRASAENTAGVLVLEVYSIKVPSDVLQEKGFALWAKALKEPGKGSGEHTPAIHLTYRLEGSFDIRKHYTAGEGSEEQIAVVGRAEPAGDDRSYTVRFSELGRPPAYDGKTALTIGPKEKRVLVLPVVELDAGEKLETVVSLEYKVEAKESGLKSKFEI